MSHMSIIGSLLGSYSNLWSGKRSRSRRGAVMMVRRNNNFLSVDDFKDTSFEGLSSLEILGEVCGVASQKLVQENLMINNNVMINKGSSANSNPHDSVAGDEQSDEFEAHTRVNNGLKRKYDCYERDGVSEKKMKTREEEELMIKKGQIHMYEPSSTSNGGGAHYNSSPVSDLMEELGQCFNVARAYRPPVLNGVLIRSTRVNSASSDNDHDDGEVGPKKKKKKMYMKSNYKKMKKGAGGVVLLNLNEAPPAPELPPEYKRVIIDKMNGTELTKLIEKELYNSDINPDYNRLTLPPNQISSHDFLTQEEMGSLRELQRKGSGLTVPLVDPMLGKEEQICLGLWKLSSKKLTYILKTQWNHIVKKKGLVAGDVVQIWSFRTGGGGGADNVWTPGQLHLALVLVRRAQTKLS